MRTAIIRKPGERGATLVFFTVLLCTFILPGVGLAIDGSFAFVTKAKLSAAVDAAALAGANALSIGLTSDDQKTSAKTIATRYFHANFPDGSMSVNLPPDPSVAVDRPGDGAVRTVSVSVTVRAPVYFMRILNFSGVNITASIIAKPIAET